MVGRHCGCRPPGLTLTCGCAVSATFLAHKNDMRGVRVVPTCQPPAEHHFAFFGQQMTWPSGQTSGQPCQPHPQCHPLWSHFFDMPATGRGWPPFIRSRSASSDHCVILIGVSLSVNACQPRVSPVNPGQPPSIQSGSASVGHHPFKVGQPRPVSAHFIHASSSCHRSASVSLR